MCTPFASGRGVGLFRRHGGGNQVGRRKKTTLARTIVKNVPRTPEWMEEVASRVHPIVRDRGSGPETAVIHLGPTNSGKTHDALQRLKERGSGVFAGPLRMLAREAYEKLCALAGAENVGLLTGEEKINEAAPIICCTTEMAPRQGDVLVLDEAQWAADTNRGYAWTRLLVGADYSRFEVAASRGAELFLTDVLSDAAHMEVVDHARLSEITYMGSTNLSDVPSRSLIVAFSRKAVHALAGKLSRNGRKVGVLYGALPPTARAEQIRKFTEGEYDVLVTTDVIGHGINIPADHVVFADTQKFDGIQRRPLRVWEAAQIAGRAGRYGLADTGHVWTLTGQPGLNPNRRLVAQAVEAAAGRVHDGLLVDSGLLRPEYEDLGAPAAHEIATALQAWQRKAADALAAWDGVEPVPINELLTRWDEVRRRVNRRSGSDLEWPLAGELCWRLITLPVDTDSDVFTPLITDLAALTLDPETPPERVQRTLMDLGAPDKLNLERAEQAASLSRDIALVGRTFEGWSVLSRPALHAEREYAARATELLAKAVAVPRFGVCRACSADCAPYFELCSACHNGPDIEDTTKHGGASIGITADLSETTPRETESQCTQLGFLEALDQMPLEVEVPPVPEMAGFPRGPILCTPRQSTLTPRAGRTSAVDASRTRKPRQKARGTHR